MLVAPDAKMDDGYLDIGVDGMGDAALVKHFMAATRTAPTASRRIAATRMRQRGRPHNSTGTSPLAG